MPHSHRQAMQSQAVSLVPTHPAKEGPTFEPLALPEQEMQPEDEGTKLGHNFDSVNEKINQTSEAHVKTMVNPDKLLDDFSQIEKKMSEINEKNNLLVLQLEKSNRLLTLSQSKEDSIKEECASLQNVIKGFRQTVENQCNLRDENERLKNNIHILEKKLKAHEQEYESQINKLVTEIRNREEVHKMELTKVYCDMNRKFELKEEEHKEQIGKKELEVLELTRQLRTQDKEKQNEIIKLQIEFNAKLARVQNKATKSFPDTTALPQNIYRRKLQHLQEEKNKEIEILRNTIRDLEKRLGRSPDFHLRRSRF